jgi:hypothetical protein
MCASALRFETPEVETGAGWRPLGQGQPPQVSESAHLRIRGLPSGSVVVVGDEERRASPDGHVRIALAESDGLRGHVGLIEVAVDGTVAGEVEIVPDKLSMAAYRRLRADLETTWLGLVTDVSGVSRLPARLPPASELWRRIERPVHGILADPREVLVQSVAPRRLSSVRRSGELRPSVLRRGLAGRSVLSRVVTRSAGTSEQAMVRGTLERLRRLATRDGDAETALRIAQLLRDPVLQLPPRRPCGTWGMRCDSRYRRVLDVGRILDDPLLAPTEGPGELRLGVRGLVRLYEYWVFLQILLVCSALYGPPLGEGFSALGRRIRGGGYRLELPAGATVTFPGPVHVAFEPVITARGDGWMGIEYVPHPEPAHVQALATPDVVVFAPGRQPWVTVVDAKYVGRAWVERSAVALHTKYARMRVGGRPAVRYVVAAHPHGGFTNMWAGYGHLGFVPGQPVPPLGPILPPVPATVSSRSPAVVVADQRWMASRLGERRVDLGRLALAAAGSGPLSEAHLVLPDVEPLAGFAHAASLQGWIVHRVAQDRAAQIHAMADLVADVAAGVRVVMVGDDPEALAEARAVRPDVSVFTALEDVPPPGA